MQLNVYLQIGDYVLVSAYIRVADYIQVSGYIKIPTYIYKAKGHIQVIELLNLKKNCECLHSS